jgi:histone acetyltransferase
MRRLLTDLQNHKSSFAFARPVNADEVTDYYDVIKHPMDLETMDVKLEANSYPDMKSFLADAQLIWENCRRYNAEGSTYVKNANRLEKHLKERLEAYTQV